MIKFLGLFLIGASALANCANDYNSGLLEYNFASRHMELGAASYDLASTEAQKEEPNIEILCDHLLNSYSGFQTATNSLQRCRDSFAKAVKTCTGDNKLRAMQASNTCHETFQVSTENKRIVRENLRGICFTQDE